MALGQAVAAQVIVAKAKGWDPTVIPDSDADLKNWDKQPKPGTIEGTPSVGRFNEKIPARQDNFPSATPDVVSDGIGWSENHPGEPNQIPSGGARMSQNPSPAPGADVIWNAPSRRMVVPPIGGSR